MKRLKRAVALLLATSFLLILPPTAGAIQANPGIRVGLLYGSLAQPGVNLANHVGSGYRFGFMNGSEFVEVGRTAETKISMVKNRDVYVTGTDTYSDSTVTGTLVGCFHDEDGLQPTREAAELRAAELRNAGAMAFVYYEKGSWGVRINSYIANKENSATKKTGSKYCISIVVTGTNNIIFQYDSLALEEPLIVAPDITGVAMPETYFKGYRYTGYFEYTRRDQNNITVVNLENIQNYVKGILPYEMSASWHIEALKAQALAARSYAVRHIGSHKSSGFDICNTDHCQVYRGRNRANDNSDRAVDETYGEYVTYDGKICDTVYSASSGGATEDVENVWGTKVDYLRGVFDVYEDLSQASDGVWSYTTTNALLSDYLRQKGYPNDGIVDFYISQYTRMGNVMEITYVDTKGKEIRINRMDRVRSFLGDKNKSARFSINGKVTGLTAVNGEGRRTDMGNESVWAVGADGVPQQLLLNSSVYIMSAQGAVTLPTIEQTNIEKGTYIVNGTGNGHSVGMSQQGARSMAELGFTYQQIIQFYYTGVTITRGG